LGEFLGKVTSSSDAPRHSGIPDKGLPFHSTIELHEAVHEKLYQKRRWRLPHIIVAVIAVALAVGALVPIYNSVLQKTVISTSMGNCRRIVTSLKIYAGEHGGRFPDALEPAPKSSNEVFRVLIRKGIVEDERLFGCMNSRYSPDGDVGTAPDYSRALEAGENHWAMTKGVSDRSVPLTPLVFENPMSASWPPTWDLAFEGRPSRGRIWQEGKVLVGFNDGSVITVKVDPATGRPVTSSTGESQKDVFTDAAASMEILNIEE
jgi:hypothetical protein